MNFREHQLPTDTNYASLWELPENTKQILDVYEGVYGRTEVYRPERANELLDAFTDQRCFIAEDDDTDEEDHDVMAVANYREEVNEGFAWIEGLAVHSECRRIGVGRFVLDNLIEVTRESGLQEIRLKSVPTAVPFYQRNGFLVIEGSQNPRHPHMSREIR